MIVPGQALYVGTVVHRRVSPVKHRLRYRVFSVLADLDDIGGLARRCRLFSHNRWNALSLYDRDHADGATPDLAWFVRDLVNRRLGFVPERVFMLTFPRVFGYVFNPLTSYFCFNRDGLAAAVYEVNNTFGGRTHYVCSIDTTDGETATASAGKRLLVSPFNGEHGRYGFRLRFSGESITQGVALKEAGKPIVNTSYAASHVEATDFNIVGLLTRFPFMTLKVVGGIHVEAARLWLKGLRPPRPLGETLRGRHDQLLGTDETGPEYKIREGQSACSRQ